MNHPHYIVVEGVIGVGKTTLVNALAQRLNARTVLEVFEENPFLHEFYADKARHAFSTEMFFLLSRFKQQELFAQEDLLQRYSVSDYLFEKCRLFASVTLSSHELALFDSVHEVLYRHVPIPDLVIYLHAPVEVLVRRIRERGRDYEQGIDPEYLAELDRRYHELFGRYTAAPVVSVDTSELDLRDRMHFETLIDRLNLPGSA